MRTNALGVAVPGGIDYAYHSARLMLDVVRDEEELARYDHDQTDASARLPDADAEAKGGICQIDFERAFQAFSRARAADEIQSSSPHLLRFFALQYREQSELLVMWRAKCVARIWSRCGAQQGDVLGGVYFFFGTAEFARTLRDSAPEVLATWIVDDLTL